MTLPMVTCPLCCRPGFSSSDSLCTALVDVTTRKLSCPICNHEVLGLDKFTIHLFSHSISRFGSLKGKDTAKINQIERNKTSFENNTSNTVSATEQQTKYYCAEKLQNNSNEEPNQILEKQDSWTCNNFPVKCTKSVLNDASLIYLRTDNGQIFALSHENLGTNLKNVTINTQNYITSTNITTSTLQTNLIGNVQKRKYCQTFDKDISVTNCKGLDSEDSPETYPNVESVPSCPSTPSISSETEKFAVCSNTAEREFESCRDLLTKGDFTTNVDDLNDLDSIDTNVAHKNTEVQNALDNLETEDKAKESSTCELCSYVFPNKTILAMHNQLIHKKVETEMESKRKLLLCNLCPRTFSLRSSLMIHRRVAHAGGFGSSENAATSKQLTQSLSCQVCGKLFSKDVHLSQHMKVHEEKQWQCNICEKAFTTKYFLKKHRRLHTGEMPYRCKTCSKSFTFQQTYRKHLLYHSNDKPYCCAQCGRLFKELSTLHNHERIHSGEKPFTCETCGKAFRQRVSYLVHRRIHTGAMPYKCTACNKSFRYKISQRTHKCTAQPPGIVVRTQGYLVERLQAAMNKAAEMNVSKNSSKEMKNNEESIMLESKITSNEVNQSSAPSPPVVAVSEVGSSTATQENILQETNKSSVKTSTEMPKIKMDKPQIYLLVKGPNGETYYQPLIFSQNLITPITQSSTEKKHDPVPSKYRKFSENSFENRIPNVDSTKKNQSNKTVFKNISGFSTLDNNTKAKNEVSLGENNIKESNKESTSFEQKYFSQKDAEKCKSVQQNAEMALVQVTNKNNDITSEMINGSSIMSELFENLYVNNASNNNLTIGNETNEISSYNRINSDSNSDTIMDSTDLFSLMLSPTLSSPSDKFGQLSLSPNSSKNNSMNLENNNECLPSFSNNSNIHNDSVNVSQDPFFENITDDTLKELLFGGVK
ncbi:uncharacterized protein [Rhodnius prolixus]|uniref:uncharacterized protein n=1 Tax=Rhodnius prolixus TaxID=13249 RepID=UPI003D18B606